jgi:hypothetical protein
MLNGDNCGSTSSYPNFDKGDIITFKLDMDKKELVLFKGKNELDRWTVPATGRI